MGTLFGSYLLPKHLVAILHRLLWRAFSSQCFMPSIAEISPMSDRRRKRNYAPLITAIFKCLLNVVFASLSKHSSIFSVLAWRYKFYVFRKELYFILHCFQVRVCSYKIVFCLWRNKWDSEWDFAFSFNRNMFCDKVLLAIIWSWRYPVLYPHQMTPIL